jgi:hypothetical protein
MLDLILQEPKFIIHRRPRYKRKGKVEYDDDSHSYYQKEEGRPDRYLISVTTFLKKFEIAFVADDENTKKTAAMYGLNKHEVKLYWENIKDVAANRGTFIHNSCEDFILWFLLDNELKNKRPDYLTVVEFLSAGVLQYKKQSKKDYIALYSILYNKYNRYTGQINCRTGKYSNRVYNCYNNSNNIIIKNRGSFDSTKFQAKFFRRFDHILVVEDHILFENRNLGQSFKVKLPPQLLSIITYVWELFGQHIDLGAKVHVEDLLFYLYPGIAGQSDLVVEGEDYIDIHDYKTNVKDLYWGNEYGKYYKFPINHLEVSKLQGYELQLSIYGYFAERLYKKPIRNLVIHHFGAETLSSINLQYKKDDVLLLINHQLNKHKNDN